MRESEGGGGCGMVYELWLGEHCSFCMAREEGESREGSYEAANECKGGGNTRREVGRESQV